LVSVYGIIIIIPGATTHVGSWPTQS